CARGANVHAEILGYGLTSDAYHMTAPLPDGSEAHRAMQIALRDAAIEPSLVDYVSAHATGTRLGDAAEAAALGTLFDGDSGTPRAVTATKPIHGHALGASPAIESVVTIEALKRDFAPGILNFSLPDENCPPAAVPMPGRSQVSKIALCNA